MEVAETNTKKETIRLAQEELIKSRLRQRLKGMAGSGIIVEFIQRTRTTEEKETVRTLVRGIHWLSVSDDQWHKAAEMASALRRKGITSSAMDTLTAITAIDYQCILLHRDSRFDLIGRHSPLKCCPCPSFL